MDFTNAESMPPPVPGQETPSQPGVGAEGKLSEAPVIPPTPGMQVIPGEPQSVPPAPVTEPGPVSIVPDVSAPDPVVAQGATFASVTPSSDATKVNGVTDPQTTGEGIFARFKGLFRHNPVKVEHKTIQDPNPVSSTAPEPQAS